MGGKRAEGGQALVGVLIVMTLVFAFAGGLAVTASSLMTDQESAFRPYLNDLSVRNIVAAAVGDGAAGTDCVLRTLPKALLPFGQPACVVVTPLGTNPPKVIAVTPSSKAGQCDQAQCATLPASSLALDQGQNTAWLWFTVRGHAVAWQEGKGPNSKCKGGQQWFPSSLLDGSVITQVVFKFDVSQSQPVCLMADTQLPQAVRYDDSDNPSPSQRVLNLAIPVGPNALEEVDLWQTSAAGSGPGAVLRWEEAL